LIEIVDVGVAGEIQSEQLVHKKVRYRTANLCEQDAMMRAEAEQAISISNEE
jgi:nicotinate-nucleotide--dimethylbenzimidazole phosphoribosyltransferase